MSLEAASHRKRSTKKHKDRSTHGSDDSTKKRKRGALNDGRSSSSKKPRTTEDNHTSGAAEGASSTVQDSPFLTHTSSLYLPLSPISQLHPLEGLCAEHLSPLILTYYPPFHGVILSYGNERLSERPLGQPGAGGRVALARSVDEYAASFVWVTADFLLFRPRRGEWIEGIVNLQNEGHVGLVCWNLFNASIERKRLPQNWTWSEAGGDIESTGSSAVNGENRGKGYYVDGDGTRIQGSVRFRVRDVETSADRERGFLSIEGTTLDDETERLLLEQERLMAGENHGRKATSAGRSLQDRTPRRGPGDGLLDLGKSKQRILN
ncbi:MAG: hypothetical protein M1832_001023 [Thelocarpon impressellum]|nr:MAG: hypothetical protein M1832_001023 [Thelocarpon impressellum]